MGNQCWPFCRKRAKVREQCNATRRLRPIQEVAAGLSGPRRPAGAWEDGWSYRWNPEAWAAQGYVVALPNPRGSTGFGQKFVDEISGDWGGKCFDDLMRGVEYLESLP